MRVLLIDVDSRLPNLALMKIAAHHRAAGDTVGFNVADPDRVYASVIFKKNKHLTDSYEHFHPGAEVLVGGSGTQEWAKVLPPEIEDLMPDYSLYDGRMCVKCGMKAEHCHCRTKRPTIGDMDYSMGSTTRGCIRRCYFCWVHRKEGEMRPWHEPAAFHPPGFKACKLLDNNWYADRERFFQTSKWFVDRKVKMDVTQGMDIRLIDDEIAARLKLLRWGAIMHFAFDDEKYTQEVLDGIEILQRAGINTKNNTYFFVYCHDDAHYESALARCQLLKEHKTSAFVMFNCDKEATGRIKHLQRWANRPQLFWTKDINEVTYDRRKWDH